MAQAALFPGFPGSFADGYFYQRDFLSIAEEAGLLREIEHLPLAPAEYRQYLARRRIVSYGGRYDFSARRLEAAQPLPPFLLPLRERVAQWCGRSVQEFTHAMIAEYSPGTPLGWHRDVPDFELIVGISLLSPCRIRFRPYPPPPRAKSIAIELAPRSIYRLEGDARWKWQHSVPPVRSLRYSITFRTQRRAVA
jgi:alkylated DNA repair dioxygenase AlkB